MTVFSVLEGQGCSAFPMLILSRKHLQPEALKTWHSTPWEPLESLRKSHGRCGDGSFKCKDFEGVAWVSPRFSLELQSEAVV